MEDAMALERPADRSINGTCRRSNVSGTYGGAVEAARPAEAALAPERPENTCSDMSRTVSLTSTAPSSSTSASTADSSSSASNNTIVASWGGSIKKVMRYARHIDLQRPIGSFSNEELDAIACAAEFLTCFDFCEEAFPLSALLLKKERAAALAPGGDSKAKVAWAAKVYKATRYTVGEVHHKMALALLANTRGTMMQVASAPPTPATCGPFQDEIRIFLHDFLLNMSLANVRRRGDASLSDIQRHYERAVMIAKLRPSPPVHLMDAIPAENLSLCWLLHIDLVRCIVYPRHLVDLLNDITWKSLGCHVFPLEHQLEDKLLRRKPGPFEMYENDQGRLVAHNPCLRSCLEWCHQQLQSLHAVSGVVRLMPFKGATVVWGANAAVVTALWERYAISAATVYHRPVAKAANAEGTIDPTDWMRDAELRFGLPPTEMLILMTWLINLAGYFPAGTAQRKVHEMRLSAVVRSGIIRTPRFRTHAELLAHFRAGCEMLRAHNDEDLARRFLRIYVDHESLCIWPLSLIAVHLVTHGRLMHEVAHALRIKMPGKRSSGGVRTVAMNPAAEAAAPAASARFDAMTPSAVLRSSLRVLTGCLRPITTTFSSFESLTTIEVPDQTKVGRATHDGEKVST